eukprot:2065931-Ditylum_brightwellii.AAC.1
MQEQCEVVKMLRIHDIEKTWPKKKQKVSTVGKYDKVSAIDSSSKQIGLSIISSQYDEFESEENE